MTNIHSTPYLLAQDGRIFRALKSAGFRTTHAVITAIVVASLIYFFKEAENVFQDKIIMFDDAYMITRYAKHWLSGDGFSWNIGDGPSYGITSPAYLFIITGVLALTDVSDEIALRYTSMASGVLTALLIAGLGLFMQEGKWRNKSWVPILAIPTLLLNPSFIFHSTRGMETTLSMLANTLLCLAIIHYGRKRNNAALLSCILASLFSFLTRPDNGLYALFFPPLYILITDSRQWRNAVVYFASVSALFVTCLLFNKLLFGDLLPLAFYAKRSGFYLGYIGAFQWNAMEYMLTFTLAVTPCLLMIFSMTTRKSAPLVALTFCLAGLTFLYLAGVTQIMGFHARYYYPTIPFFFMAAFSTQGHVSNNALPSGSFRYDNWRFILMLTVLIPVLSQPIKMSLINLWQNHVIKTVNPYHPARQYQTISNKELPELTGIHPILAILDLLKQLPGGTVLAASEYGLIGSYLPQLKIIDMVGLHDREVAHAGFDTNYILAQNPDLIWFPHNHYTHEVGTLLDNPAFANEYEYYPSAYILGIALRKQSPHYSTIRQLFEKEFKLKYPGLTAADYLAIPRQ